MLKIPKHPDSLLRIFVLVLGFALTLPAWGSLFGDTVVLANSQMSFQELLGLFEQLHNYKPRQGWHPLAHQGTVRETFTPETFRLICTQKALIEGIYRGEFFVGNPILQMPLNYGWEYNLPRRVFSNNPSQENYAWVTSYLLMIECQVEIFQSKMSVTQALGEDFLVAGKAEIEYLKTIHDMVMAGKSVEAREHILIKFLSHPANYLDFVEKLYFQEGTFKNFIAAFDNWIDYNYKLYFPSGSEGAPNMEIPKSIQFSLLQDKWDLK